MIDVKRLRYDRKYWDSVACDDEATHYCTISGGFEYLTKGDICDIPKPSDEYSEIRNHLLSIITVEIDKCTMKEASECVNLILEEFTVLKKRGQ